MGEISYNIDQDSQNRCAHQGNGDSNIVLKNELESCSSTDSGRDGPVGVARSKHHERHLPHSCGRIPESPATKVGRGRNESELGLVANGAMDPSGLILQSDARWWNRQLGDLMKRFLA